MTLALDNPLSIFFLLYDIIVSFSSCLSLSSLLLTLTLFQTVAGQRTVPVELGSAYTDDDWSQRLMTLSEYIEQYMITKVVHR